jgi:O-antigen/teichoic acid export membrane protein
MAPFDLAGKRVWFSGERSTAGTSVVRRLRDSAAARKVAANTGWLLGDRLVRAALGFLVGAWVARYLGPDRFGHLAYVIAFIALFQTSATLGADSIVVRDIARDPAAAPEILGSIVRLRLLAGAVCWMAAVGLMALIDPHATDTIVLTAIIAAVMIFQTADTVDLWFQSQVQSRRTVVAKLIAYIVSNGLKVALILMKAPLVAFAAAFLFDFALAALALVLAYRGFTTVQHWRFESLRARRLLRDSWPFLVSGLSVSIYMRIDQVMLKSLGSVHDVGIFSAALPLSQIWQVIPVALAISLAPYIAQRKLAGEAAYEAALRQVFRLFALLALAAAIATFVAAPLLIPLVYGPAFVGSVAVLQIHVFSNVFIAMAVAQGLWIANEQAGRLLIIQTFAGASVAIVGNLLAIPRWGPEGAAAVAVIAHVTSGLLVNAVFAPRLFRMQLGLATR